MAVVVGVIRLRSFLFPYAERANPSERRGRKASRLTFDGISTVPLSSNHAGRAAQAMELLSTKFVLPETFRTQKPEVCHESELWRDLDLVAKLKKINFL